MQFLNNLLGLNQIQQQLDALKEENTQLKIQLKLLRTDLEDCTDIDYDTIVDHIDLNELARKCSYSFDADDIARHIDASDIADEIRTTDIVEELEIDYSELSDHLDLDAISDYVDDAQVAEDVCKRLMNQQLVFQSR